MNYHLSTVIARLPLCFPEYANPLVAEGDPHVESDDLYRVWAVTQFCEALGVVEHTGDWDWWIQITHANHELVRHDCGSSFLSVTDSNGTVWTDPIAFGLQFTTSPITSITISSIDSEQDELGLMETEVTIPIQNIRAIESGFEG